MDFNPYNNSILMVVSAENGLKRVVHRKGQTKLIDMSLRKLEKLYGEYFIKVHESFLVNVNFIQEYYPKNEEYSDIQGDGGHIVLADYNNKEHSAAVSRRGIKKLFNNDNFDFIVLE